MKISKKSKICLNILCLVMLFISSSFLFACKNYRNTGKVIVEKPFYSLQAAYNQGIISKKDLQTISELFKEIKNLNMSEEVENEIKRAYKSRYPQEEDILVKIDRYLGDYNDCEVIMISYVNDQYLQMCWTETVAGIKFQYNTSQRILVWKK